jgi:hypothetical protein
MALVAAVSVALAGACGGREAPQESTAAFRPTATIKDIMTSIIDPESDVLWNAVATVVSATGTEERRPSTEEEWTALRRSAIQLVEATNLLLVPGRQVARPGEKSENPKVELEPPAIQRLIADDPAGWAKLVGNLHAAAAPALKAIDERNADDLFVAGGHLEDACEACHQRYWYPPGHSPAWQK